MFNLNVFKLNNMEKRMKGISTQKKNDAIHVIKISYSIESTFE